MKHLTLLFLMHLLAPYWSVSSATELPLVALKLHSDDVLSRGINKRVDVRWPDDDASFSLCSHEPLVYTQEGGLTVQVFELGDRYLYRVSPAGNLSGQPHRSHLIIENHSAIDLGCSSLSRGGISHALNRYTDSSVNSTTIQLDLRGIRHDLDKEGRYQITVNEASIWSWFSDCWKALFSGGGYTARYQTNSPEPNPMEQVNRRDDDEGDEDDEDDEDDNPDPSSPGSEEDEAEEPDLQLLSQFTEMLDDPEQLGFLSHALALEYPNEPAFIQAFINDQGAGLTIPEGEYNLAFWKHLLEQIQGSSDKEALLKALITSLTSPNKVHFKRAAERVKEAVVLTGSDNQSEAAVTIAAQMDEVSFKVNYFWLSYVSLHQGLPTTTMQNTSSYWKTLLLYFVNYRYRYRAVSFLYEVSDEDRKIILRALKGSE